MVSRTFSPVKATAVFPARLHSNFVFVVTLTLLVISLSNSSSAQAQSLTIDFGAAVKNAKKKIEGALSSGNAKTTISFEQKLSKSERRQVQQNLNAIGFDTGTPDGVFGRNTRSAIRLFQASFGLPVTGQLTRRGLEQLDLLVSNPSPVTRPSSPVQHSASSPELATPSLTINEATVSEYGADYQELLKYWLAMQGNEMPDSIKSVIWAYGLTDISSKSEYCSAISQMTSRNGNSIQSANELDTLTARFQQSGDFSNYTLPATIELEVAVRNPYKDYDLNAGTLSLVPHRFNKRIDLADGRRGVDFSPCKSLANLPVRAQVGFEFAIPETFEFKLLDLLNQNNSSDAFNILHNVSVDRSVAQELLGNNRNNTALTLRATIQLEKPGQLDSTTRGLNGFKATLLSVTSFDQNTGAQLHNLQFETGSSQPAIASYSTPLPAPENSGLPDGLAWFDDSIVVFPPNALSPFKRAPETEVALRRLTQKLVLQANPQQSYQPELGIYFSDLANDSVGQYFQHQSVIEAAPNTITFKWDTDARTDFSKNVATGWKPTADQFEFDRLKRRFADEQAASLLAEEISLPFDVATLIPVEIGQYSFDVGGFPLRGTRRTPSFNFSAARIEMTGSNSYSRAEINSLVNTLLPIKNMPEVWTMSAEEGERVQNEIAFAAGGIFSGMSAKDLQTMAGSNPTVKQELARNQTVQGTMAVRMRVTGITAKESRRDDTPVTAILDMAAVSIKLYQDRNLQHFLAELPLPGDSIVTSKSEDQEAGWKSTDVKRLTPDNLRMLYISALENEPTNEFWRTSAEQRKKFEKLLAGNSWQSFKALKPYWEILNARSVLNSIESLSKSDIEKYRNWTGKRLAHLGDRFYLPGLRASSSGGRIITEELFENVNTGLARLMSSNGLEGTVSQEAGRANKAALADIKRLYPDSLQQYAVSIGDDLIAGFAISEDTAWYSQSWESEAAVKPEDQALVYPLLEMTVTGSHAIETSSGKQGVILEIAPSGLALINPDSTELQTFRKTAGNLAEQVTELDILGVKLGMTEESALATLKQGFDGPLITEKLDNKDPALPKAIRAYSATEQDPSQGPTTIVDLYFDGNQDKVLAIGRILSYPKLGITPQQIADGLIEKYGVEASRSDYKGIGLGWGATALTNGRLKSSFRFNDDCMLRPVQVYGYRKMGPLSTKQLRSACGNYLIANVERERTSFLLVDSDSITNIIKSQQEIVQAEKEAIKEESVKKIKF